jgi:hypothetical protein
MAVILAYVIWFLAVMAAMHVFNRIGLFITGSDWFRNAAVDYVIDRFNKRQGLRRLK